MGTAFRLFQFCWPGQPEEGGFFDKSGTLERGVLSGSEGLQRLLSLTLSCSQDHEPHKRHKYFSKDCPDGMSRGRLSAACN